MEEQNDSEFVDINIEEKILPLLKSDKAEEKLAGLLLLSKNKDGSSHVESHRVIRPFLVKLLKSNAAYHSLVLSVLAVSSESIPFEEKFAKELWPLLVDLFEKTDAMKSDVIADLILCILCVKKTEERMFFEDSKRLFERNCEVLKKVDESSTLHRCVSLFIALCQSSRVLIKDSPSNLSALIRDCARLFGSYQNELKFELLSLFLELCGFDCLRKRRLFEEMAPVLRKSLFDILRAKKSNAIWSVFKCFLEISSVLTSINWSIKDNDGFFPLLFGMVGVEFAMLFDDEIKDNNNDQMLMICGELLEMIMNSFKEEEMLSMLKTDQILHLRDKLNDINRVALEHLLTNENVEKNKLKKNVCIKIVSTWSFLDPESLKEKEVILLQPIVVSHLCHFLNPLSEYWCSTDGIRDKFLSLNGVSEVCQLIRNHCVQCSNRTIHNETDELDYWNECLLNGFDSMINCCSVFIICCGSKKPLNVEFDLVLLKNVVQASKSLFGKNDDSSTLLGFLIAFVSSYLKEVPLESCGKEIEDSLRESIGSLLAIYIPIALKQEGITTVKKIIELIEDGDYFGVKKYAREMEITKGLSVSEQEDAEIIKKLTKALK